MRGAGKRLTPGNDTIPGVFLDDTDTYEVNLRIAEVYTHGQLVMPVTKAIAGHPTFHHVFRDRAPVLCMLGSSTTNRQHVRAGASWWMGWPWFQCGSHGCVEGHSGGTVLRLHGTCVQVCMRVCDCVRGCVWGCVCVRWVVGLCVTRLCDPRLPPFNQVSW